MALLNAYLRNVGYGKCWTSVNLEHMQTARAYSQALSRLDSLPIEARRRCFDYLKSECTDLCPLFGSLVLLEIIRAQLDASITIAACITGEGLLVLTIFLCFNHCVCNQY
jgi:hypothetical protein